MKVFVIGANGQIGRELVKQIQTSDQHEVRAMVRDQAQADTLKAQSIEAVVCDLEDPAEAIEQAGQGCDVFVFTAGSGGHTGADKTLQIDLEGAARAIEAAQKLQVKQFIMVSAIHADDKDKWTAIIPYMIAKHHADRILKESGLPYTIVRPGGLLNEPAKGKVKIAEHVARATIPREDVAHVLYEAIGNEKLISRTFELVSGEDSISEAINNL